MEDTPSLIIAINQSEIGAPTCTSMGAVVTLLNSSKFHLLEEKGSASQGNLRQLFLDSRHDGKMIELGLNQQKCGLVVDLCD